MCIRDSYEGVHKHGQYKTRINGRVSFSKSESNVLIVKVELRRKPCILPIDINVMVVHFHHVTAKGDCGKKEARATFLTEIVELIREHNVTLFMTDANMALLLVHDKLRSSGVNVDTVEWWPWQLQDGTMGMDSCCILLIDQPGKHKLGHDLEAFKAGTLWENASVLPGYVEDNSLKECPGYGQRLTSYCTKPQQTFHEAMEAFLTPSYQPQDSRLMELGRSRGRDKDSRRLSAHNASQYNRVYLNTRQLKLDNELRNFLYERGTMAERRPFPSVLYHADEFTSFSESGGQAKPKIRRQKKCDRRNGQQNVWQGLGPSPFAVVGSGQSRKARSRGQEKAAKPAVAGKQKCTRSPKRTPIGRHAIG